MFGTIKRIFGGEPKEVKDALRTTRKAKKKVEVLRNGGGALRSQIRNVLYTKGFVDSVKTSNTIPENIEEAFISEVKRAQKASSDLQGLLADIDSDTASLVPTDVGNDDTLQAQRNLQETFKGIKDAFDEVFSAIQSVDVSDTMRAVETLQGVEKRLGVTVESLGELQEAFIDLKQRIRIAVTT